MLVHIVERYRTDLEGCDNREYKGICAVFFDLKDAQDLVIEKSGYGVHNYYYDYEIVSMIVLGEDK